MSRISDMWLVVHVPKTAGTSFRQAMERYYGVDKVVRDYGPDASATNEIVQNHFYGVDKPRSPGELVQLISGLSKKVLVGHFSVRKYVDYFEPERIICFVRDPLIRTCSEYMHRKRNATYDGSFTAFMHEPSIRNIQSRFLRGIPDKALIGLTEHYRESIKYINDSFQLRLSTLKRNVDRKGGGQKFAGTLSTEELELFERLNQEDLALYKRATDRFGTLDIQPTEGRRLTSWWKTDR